MEQSNKKPRKHFTSERKYEIIKDIEAGPIVREALEKHGINGGLCCKWRHQLKVGINASPKKTKPLESPDVNHTHKIYQFLSNLEKT